MSKGAHSWALTQSGVVLVDGAKHDVIAGRFSTGHTITVIVNFYVRCITFQVSPQSAYTCSHASMCAQLRWTGSEPGSEPIHSCTRPLRKHVKAVRPALSICGKISPDDLAF